MSQSNRKLCKFPEERQRLLAMAKQDQAIRRDGDFSRVSTELEMRRIDWANQRELRTILRRINLPSAENIGMDGAEAAWLIAQHCYFDISLLISMLRRMQKCMAKNPRNGYWRGIPYLIDRSRLAEGKPQLYGTQIWGPAGVTPQPYTIEDPDNLDVRRSQYGLEPFADYLKAVLAEAR
jgi:hypothetical protein